MAEQQKSPEQVVLDREMAAEKAYYDGFEIVETAGAGRKASYNAAGEKTDEWAVDEFGRRVADAGPGVTSPPPEATAPRAPAASPQPPADAAPAEPAEPPVDYKARAAELERELARYRTAAPAPVAPPPEQKPAQRGRVKLDFSDFPDINDVDKFPDESAQRAALEDYAQRKYEAAAQAEEQLRARETQTAEAARQRDEKIARGRAAVDETVRLASTKERDADSVRRGVAELFGHMTPGWQGGNDPRNMAMHVLTATRDDVMRQRTEARMPLAGYEGVPELLAEQVKDPEFGKAVALAFPRTEISANVLGMIGYIERPTRILRHLVSEDGKSDLAQLIGMDVAGLPAGARDAVLTDVGRRIARLDHLLDAQPAKQAAPKQAPAAKPAPGETPAQALARGFHVPQDDRPSPPPALPSVRHGFTESVSTPRGSIPGTGRQEHEVFSEAWVAEHWPQLVQEERRRGGGWELISEAMIDGTSDFGRAGTDPPGFGNPRPPHGRGGERISSHSDGGEDAAVPVGEQADAAGHLQPDAGQRLPAGVPGRRQEAGAEA